MKLNLTTYRSQHSYHISCCGGDDLKITKRRAGRCFIEMRVKCNKCGMKGLFKYWHYEGYTPTKKEKEAGEIRQKTKTEYTFNIALPGGRFQ